MMHQPTVHRRSAASLLPVRTSDFRTQLSLLADPALQVPQFLSGLLEATAAEIPTRREAMIESLFIKAILNRVQPGGEDRGHIYLKQFEIPQIVLFDLLTHHYPFVSVSHDLANAAIARQLHHCRTAVLLDAGIGRGMQTLRLLERMKDHHQLRHLTIIGVEPFADALAFTKEAIEAVTPALPFEVSFIPVHSLVEHLDPITLSHQLPLQYDQLVVNSSLTLHHLQHTAHREKFFRLVQILKADAVTLIEPDSDLMQGDWEARMLQAYAHYSAVFQVIDQLDVDEADKNGLKLFFDREIDDAVARPEAIRNMRHEEGRQWVGYLKAAGFTPRYMTAADTLHPLVASSWTEDQYLSLRYQDIPMLSVICGTGA